MNNITQTIRLLVLGDCHIPDRHQYTDMPKSMINKINSLNIDKIFYTGDFTNSKELYDLLMGVIDNNDENLFVALGNMDGYHSRSLFLQNIPEIKKEYMIKDSISFPIKHKDISNPEVTTNPFIKIGMIHGHQVHPRGDLQQLYQKAQEMEIDILLTGHTHCDDIQILNDDVLLINPGSATGAWSFLASKIPSFVYLQLHYVNEPQEELLYEIQLFQYSNNNKETQKILWFKRGDRKKLEIITQK